MPPDMVLFLREAMFDDTPGGDGAVRVKFVSLQ